MSRPSRPELLAVLGILALQVLVISPHLGQDLVLADDWGHAQLVVYARNFLNFDLATTRGLPVFGFVGDRPIHYVNHPWLASWLLAGWMYATGADVWASRTLALLFSLVSVVAVWRIGRAAAGPAGGLTGALLFALIPISQRMAVSYCMELPNQTMSLVALAFLVEWERRPRRGMLAGALASLAVAQGCDVYTLGLVPFLLLRAWKRPELRRGLLGAALVPVLVQAAAMGYLLALDALAESWRLGAAHYSSPWTHWVNPDFYRTLGVRAREEFTAPVLAAAAVGLVVLLRRRSGGFWVLSLLGFALAFSVASAHGIFHHRFLIFYYAAPVALLAGAAFGSAPRWVALAVPGAVALWLALSPVAYFEPAYSQDPETARLIRELTTEEDLLVGLPPHLAAWIGRRQMVPYSYFWDDSPPEERHAGVAALVRQLTLEARPRRVVLFTRFLRRDLVPVQVPEALDDVPGYRRRSRPDLDPIVWERTD